MTVSSFAASAIQMTMVAPDQPLEFDAMLGVALRRNPQRAHLLVSRALGKHTPQRPDIVDSAAKLLAVKAKAAVEQVPIDVDAELTALNEALLLATPAPRVPNAPTDAIVVGFAEAASALGASVADHLGGFYVCSTRTPDRVPYCEFAEEHSHASAHFLTPADRARLDDATKPVILADDELTTGRTAMNLIRVLHSQAPHPRYVIATLADLRDRTSRERLEVFAMELDVDVDVVALFTGELSSASDAVDRVDAAIAELTPTTPAIANSASYERITVNAELMQARDGIQSFAAHHAAASDIAFQLRELHGQSVLVLAVEEDMILPLLVAQRLHDAGVETTFSSTTRSPAAVIDRPDYPVRDAHAFTGSDGAPRFVYNIAGRFDHAVVIVSDPLIADNAQRLAGALADSVPRVTHVTVAGMPVPLGGPSFGTYEPGDVGWLVKDLSTIDIEVDLETREDLVQRGGHYAETLPEEFQPDDEYLTLFRRALAVDGERLARDLAVLGERIWSARRGRPVLVSLARAGTPIGVLLRRWFALAHGSSVPHYAVSIVRGRGIDHNALRYIAGRHDPRDVVFVDGWTGKGAIKAELDSALQVFADQTAIRFPNDLAVVADTGQVTNLYGTRDDYLIPSAALNSTVSGLISRTVLNDRLVGPSDYHGAKFYAHLGDADVSRWFVDEVTKHLSWIGSRPVPAPADAATWAAWADVERIAAEYGIGNVNLVKPGVGETTRVLLRRVPWRILLHPDAGDAVAHIRALAKTRGVPVKMVPGLPFRAVGLIHPVQTKGATGFDGRAAA